MTLCETGVLFGTPVLLYKENHRPVVMIIYQDNNTKFGGDFDNKISSNRGSDYRENGPESPVFPEKGKSFFQTSVFLWIPAVLFGLTS